MPSGCSHGCPPGRDSSSGCPGAAPAGFAPDPPLREPRLCETHHSPGASPCFAAPAPPVPPPSRSTPSVSLCVTTWHGGAAPGAVWPPGHGPSSGGSVQEGVCWTGPTEGWGHHELGQAGRQETEGQAPATRPFSWPRPAPDPEQPPAPPSLQMSCVELS